MTVLRILPMSKDEFKHESARNVQNEFFLDKLPNKNLGKYNFRRNALLAEPGTIVLFQYDNTIVASGKYASIERFDSPRDGYHGALIFDVESIEIFDPVTAETMRKVWPKEFDRFSNEKQTLSASRYATFRKNCVNVQPLMLQNAEACDLGEPGSTRIKQTVSRIIRDTAQSKRIKALHHYSCQIIGCESILERADGLRYAEAHHIRPLGQPHNGSDIPGNILCLCPNHHAACDLGIIELDITSLKNISGHKVDPKYVQYHNQNIYVVS